MDDVEQVFTGKFKEQRSSDLSWTPVPEEQVPRPRWVGLGPGLVLGYQQVLMAALVPDPERALARAPLPTTSPRSSSRTRRWRSSSPTL